MPKITMNLKCVLSDEERLDRGVQMTTAMLRIPEVEREKSDTMSVFKKQLEELEGTVQRLSRQVRDGVEFRGVSCIVEFHTPTPGIKRTTRLDTGEFVKDESMSSFEMQENLFVDPVSDVPQGAVDAALAQMSKDNGTQSMACMNGQHGFCNMAGCACDCHKADAVGSE